MTHTRSVNPVYAASVLYTRLSQTTTTFEPSGVENITVTETFTRPRIYIYLKHPIFIYFESSFLCVAIFAPLTGPVQVFDFCNRILHNSSLNFVHIELVTADLCTNSRACTYRCLKFYFLQSILF